MTSKKQRPAGNGKSAGPSPRLRHLQAAMRLIREYGVSQGRLLMSRAEYETARAAIREAVALARRAMAGDGNLPKTIAYAGGVFRLAYTSYGRVAICDHAGNLLLCSGAGALWD